MRTTRRRSRHLVMIFLGALAVTAVSVPVTAALAIAKPATRVPVCAAAHDLVVDVSKRSATSQISRLGTVMYGPTSPTPSMFTSGPVGAQQYYVRKEIEGIWVSIAGLSPGSVARGQGASRHKTAPRGATSTAATPRP
jgi:hypothetical protein